MRAVQEAEQVDGDHRAPLVRVGVGHRAEQHHARVVHEDVQAAELVVRALDEGARLLLVRDVHLLDEGLPFNALRDGLKAVGPARAQRHARTRPGQGAHGGLPDTG